MTDSVNDYCPVCQEPYQEAVAASSQHVVQGEGITLCNGEEQTYVHYDVHYTPK